MSCFFCESSFHLSQNCDQYLSDGDRKNIVKDRKCCVKCLVPLNLHTLCLPRCNTCFSDEHNTVYCKEKCVSAMFLPKIDVELYSRFCQTWNSIEHRFSMIALSPKFVNSKPNKNIAVFKNASSANFTKYCQCHIVLNGSIEISSFNEYIAFSRFPVWLMKAKIIKLSNVDSFSTQVFFRLLTPHVKVLSCFNVEFNPFVSFSKLIKAIPNIEELQLEKTELDCDKSFVEDLWQYKKGKSLKTITLTIDYLEIDFETLADFMQSRMPKGSNVFIRISNVKKHSFLSAAEKILKNLKQYFVAQKYPDSYEPTLHLSYETDQKYDAYVCKKNVFC